MDNSSYCEVLVKVKRPRWEIILSKALWIALAVYLVAGLFYLIAWILAIPFLIGAILMKRRVNQEFEYQYLDGTLRVDRIINMKKRTKVGSYDVENLTVMAPEGSDKLTGALMDKSMKTLDCSSGDKSAANRYMAVYRGREPLCLILEPNDHLLQLMWRSAPSKVTRKAKSW